MRNPFHGTQYENACLSKIDFDQEQLDILSKYVQNPKGFLYVYSGTGVGKTYFCAAITNMKINEQKRYCWYQDESSFYNNLFNKMNSKSESTDEEIKKMTEQEFLIYDDLGCLTFSDPAKKNWHRDVLFSLIDGCGNQMTPMVITSNYAPDDLYGVFHERFVSRIKDRRNTIIKLKGEDKRLHGV